MNTVRLLVLASFVHLIAIRSLISLFTKQHSLLMNVMLGVIKLNVVVLSVMVPFLSTVHQTSCNIGLQLICLLTIQLQKFKYRNRNIPFEQLTTNLICVVELL